MEGGYAGKIAFVNLTSGEIHESDINDRKTYRKLLFEKHKIAMNAERFSFQQSSFGGVRGDRELSAQDMIVIVDSLSKIRDKFSEEFDLKLNQYFKSDTSKTNTKYTAQKRSTEYILLRVRERINTARSTISTSLNRLDNNKRSINRFWVEIHKKYSIPFACIVFVLIGAPLGTMTRKGGFGVAAGISLIFFLVYWAFLIGGEKLADRGLLSPFWGMWSANIFLGILGVYFVIKSAKERITLDFSFLQKLLPKRMRNNISENENS